MVPNQDNVSERSDMLFQWASTIASCELVLYKVGIIIISLNVTRSRHYIAKNLSFGVTQQSLAIMCLDCLNLIWIYLIYMYSGRLFCLNVYAELSW